MLDPSLSHLAVGGVVLLITVLAFPPQIFLLNLPLDGTVLFNYLIALVYLTYYQAITTSPGRVPHSWTPTTLDSTLETGAPPPDASSSPSTSNIISTPPRFCSTCDAFKPPRAHHCRVCNVCIPKMDHHCPWTANCVGYANHPQFMRFLIYTNLTLGLLNWFLLGEWVAVYDAWDQPAYLFPHEFWGMCGLVAASFLAAGTGLALFIILARSGMNAATGITTIETWEVERHEARARRHGGKRRAFPFDFGLYENLKVAFGYRSMWIWMWPWAKAKPVGSLVPCFEGDGHVTAGCTWEGNGVQPGAGWPPEDQGDDDDDEGPRQHIESGNPWMVDNVADVEGFRRRQKEDIERKKKGKGVEKRNKVGEKEKEEIGKGWKNSEGEGLADFGVDEDAEDDDVPLGVLMRKRRERAAR